MPQNAETLAPEYMEHDYDTRGEARDRFRWRRGFSRAARATGRGLKRSGKTTAGASRTVGEMIEDSSKVAARVTGRGAKRSGKATARAARKGGRVAQRSGEVMTGADIRRFDEFTEAVTRVAVGLHHDQADVKERVARLEQEAAEIRRFQAELADRLTAVEQMYAA